MLHVVPGDKLITCNARDLPGRPMGSLHVTRAPDVLGTYSPAHVAATGTTVNFELGFTQRGAKGYLGTYDVGVQLWWVRV